jgi:hypothetical protein
MSRASELAVTKSSALNPISEFPSTFTRFSARSISSRSFAVSLGNAHFRVDAFYA